MAISLEEPCGPARQVGVNQKPHGGILEMPVERRNRLRRQCVVLFLFDNLSREFQGSPDVLGGNAVLLLQLLKGHPARQAADDPRHRNARTAYHGLPMLNPRIDNDSFVHGLDLIRAGSWLHPGQ
jgi:hypothetical protein